MNPWLHIALYVIGFLLLIKLCQWIYGQ